RDTPIRRKLMTVILLTSGVVLLLTCVAFFGYEFLVYRQATIRELTTIGKIIADNSNLALAVENKHDCEEVLASLQAEPHVVAAALYDKYGKLFSQYPAGLSAAALPIVPGDTGYHFGYTHLAGFQPVV